MFSNAILFIRSNIITVAAYLGVAVLAVIISKFMLPLFALVLMLSVAFLGLNFFITASGLIRDNADPRSIRTTFLRFDKDLLLKIFILLLFFIAIYLLAHVPLVIYTMTPLKAKFSGIMAEHTVIPFLLGLVATALTVFFKMVLMTSVATIIYFRNGIIDAAKGGLNTILKLRPLFIICILMFMLDALIPHLTENRLIIVYSGKILDFLITPFIFLMTFYYYREKENEQAG